MAKELKSTKEQLDYARAYYQNNKQERLKRQSEYRAEQEAKRLDNIAKGKPEFDGLPPSAQKRATNVYSKQHLANKKSKEDKRLYDRIRKKAERDRKAEERKKLIREQYKKDFGG